MCIRDRFRIWASALIKQYLLKGYAIDRRRLDHYNELKDVMVKVVVNLINKDNQ